MNKLFLNYLIVFALMFLQACDSSANSKNQTNGGTQTLKGYYIYGHEANTFQPCGQKLVYWVNASNEMLERLEKGNYSPPFALWGVQLHPDKAAHWGARSEP
ncbi:MAG TPA: hypothetical protein VIM41_07520 [Gammaproteobacteria bacterium]